MGSLILDFIKIILVTKYAIKSIKATDPVTKLFFIKSNIGNPTQSEFVLKTGFFLFEVKVYQKM